MNLREEGAQIDLVKKGRELRHEHKEHEGIVHRKTLHGGHHEDRD